jgi:hypothetical protein
MITERSIFGILWDSLELLGIVWNYFAQTLRICFDNVISEFDQRTFESCEQKKFAFVDRRLV